MINDHLNQYVMAELNRRLEVISRTAWKYEAVRERKKAPFWHSLGQFFKKEKQHIGAYKQSHQ